MYRYIVTVTQAEKNCIGYIVIKPESVKIVSVTSLPLIRKEKIVMIASYFTKKQYRYSLHVLHECNNAK